MPEPTFDDTPRPFLLGAGADISPFGLWRSEPLIAIGFSCVPWRAGSGDGRGGNAKDRRKARRAGRRWRSLGDMVNLPRGAEDAPDVSERAASLMETP